MKGKYSTLRKCGHSGLIQLEQQKPSLQLIFLLLLAVNFRDEKLAEYDYQMNLLLIGLSHIYLMLRDIFYHQPRYIHRNQDC